MIRIWICLDSYHRNSSLIKAFSYEFSIPFTISIFFPIMTSVHWRARLRLWVHWLKWFEVGISRIKQSSNFITLGPIRWLSGSRCWSGSSSWFGGNTSCECFGIIIISICWCRSFSHNCLIRMISSNYCGFCCIRG